MRVPAEQFLTWRAFGAPPIVIALAAQGTFRGFKDTKTPLYAIGKLQHASLSLSLSLSLSPFIYVCVYGTYCICTFGFIFLLMPNTISYLESFTSNFFF